MWCFYIWKKSGQSRVHCSNAVFPQKGTPENTQKCRRRVWSLVCLTLTEKDETEFHLQLFLLQCCAIFSRQSAFGISSKKFQQGFIFGVNEKSFKPHVFFNFHKKMTAKKHWKLWWPNTPNVQSFIAWQLVSASCIEHLLWCSHFHAHAHFYVFSGVPIEVSVVSTFSRVRLLESLFIATLHAWSTRIFKPSVLSLLWWAHSCSLYLWGIDSTCNRAE